jgi:small subunit ribosomal protein S18
MTSEAQSPAGDRGGPPGGDRERRPPRRFGGRRKVCRLCADHIAGVDYKDVARLRMYVSDRGKIEPRRKTGTCQKHQRIVAVAIKRARHMALLPYTLAHVRATRIFPTRG